MQRAFSIFQTAGETADDERRRRTKKTFVWGELGRDANYFASLRVYVAGCRFPFSRRPLDNETQTSDVNKSKGRRAARRGRQCTVMRAQKALFFRYGFVSSYLVCQSRKFHLVQKCKCCKAQGHPPKREQWPQAGGGADTAFEPNQEALMCNL